MQHLNPFTSQCEVHILLLGHRDDSENFDPEAESLAVSSLIGLLMICLPLLFVAALVFVVELFASPKKRNGKRQVCLGT